MFKNIAGKFFNGTSQIVSATKNAGSLFMHGTIEVAHVMAETTKVVASQIVKGVNEKLSDSQNGKKTNFEETAILHFNACLDDLVTFKQAIKNYAQDSKDLDIDSFSERETLICHMIENPSLYNIYEGRLEYEIYPSGLNVTMMEKSDIILYGIARFYATESNGLLEYYNATKAKISTAIDDLVTSRTSLLESYTLALHDSTKSIPLEPQTIYVLLPPNDNQSINTMVLSASGETLTKTIPFSSLGEMFNPDITFETLKKISSKVILAAGIPEIDKITQQISIEEADYREKETIQSQTSTQHLDQIRSKLNTLLPLRVAFDKINTALSKANIHQDLMPEVICLLDQYRQLTSNDLSKDTSLLLKQLRNMTDHIDDRCTFMVSQAIKQLLNDVVTRYEIKNTINQTDEKNQRKPLTIPQYTSNKPIPWTHETIDVSNHPMPLFHQETNHNGTWMIIACLMGGTILIAASVALVALSHGATTPIGVAGITLGTNLISAAAGSLSTLGLFGFGAAYGVTMYSNDEVPKNRLS